ncbi:ribokinase protein [Halorhabdus tiamatea SARL4B]|uniref:Ribokinase protein n=1 Tax=Halorhabdus tiamatea SARL4B TaxID=1033806 RepID=F7PQX0_9EURY|nr:carbohydrate kinase family protein [Halorhabdus tiamatea]ERJ04899.1 ribokinase protein [Halorhabdus tiamatea SARL4B]CCQ33202.1 sugar kinase [Halorhabdus tiamatea SARL4B]
MASIVTVGSAVIDRVYVLSNLPEPDGGAFVTDYEERAGGVAANVACALGALEHETAVLSRVGHDDAAELIVDSLQGYGVDVSAIQRGSADSSYTLVLRGPDGNRMIVAGGDSVPELRLGERDRDRLQAADGVFTSAYAPDRVVSELVELRRAGDIARLVFDLSGPLSELEGRGTAPETIDALAGTADLFITNEVAARSYLERAPEDAARRLNEAGAARVAVTAGSDGAYLAESGTDPIHVPAVGRDVVDTTGAGDQFTAALTHAWVLDGQSPAEAGRTAATAAAQNCTAAGPRGALATPADLRGDR